ncbi:Thymidylate kinase [Coemansia sp. RSA 1199]|nr:Thymidylate kinase [Coemansia sp. RSA 1199]
MRVRIGGMSRGLFILFEGCDRSGKTTQSTRLVQALNDSGVNAKLVKFPDRTTAIGQMIDGYLTQKTQLSDHAIHLLFSANRWEAMDQMRADLESGITLVVDRYAFSGVAFSAAKRLDLKWCKSPDIGLIAPDRVFFMDIHPDDAAKRAGYGEEVYEKREMQLDVRAKFFSLMDKSWLIIDAMKDADLIHRQIVTLTKKALQAQQEEPAPIGKLNSNAEAATAASVASMEYVPVSVPIASASGAPGAAAAVDAAAGAVPVDGTKLSQSGSAAPLFDFDLAPYNVALDIVADALEKLAKTMEPLDVPLPLVGPGYYLEVQVKSPKNPQAQSPIGQINPVSIEGGQAPPVTEIDIILPGDSDVHQTIILPASGQSVPVVEESIDAAVPSASDSAPVSIPAQEPEEVSDEYVASIVGATAADSVSMASSSGEGLDSASSGSTLVPPLVAGTESAAGPLFIDDEASLVEASPVSGSQLAQTISPEELMPMETVSGFESNGELDGSLEAEVSGSTAESEDGLDILTPMEPSADAELPLQSQDESEFAQVTDGAYGASVSLEEQSLSASMQSSPESQNAVSSSSDFLAGLFPSAASSAPIASELGSASNAEESQLEPEIESESESQAEIESKSESQAEIESESGIDSESASAPSGNGDMTMVSELLPFPPFGGPQTQQLPIDEQDSESMPPSESVPAAATDAPIVEGSNVIETINIVGAPDENALESSIDAVLHSVIQDYKTESIPKAAVGFALIHPRSAAIPDNY